MRSWFVRGFLILLNVALLATAVEPPARNATKPAADTPKAPNHAVKPAAQPGVLPVKVGHDVADPKAKLQVTPVSEWDPDMELVPFNAKEGLRLMLAYTRTQIDAVEKDTRLSADEKAKQKELLEKFMKSLLVTFQSVNEYSSVATGIFICPLGIEVPLTMLLPEKWKGVKPSIAGAGCGLLAMTKHYGTNGTDGFVLGIGAWTGVQVTTNDKAPDGTAIGGMVELQHSFGVILPMNGRAPILKLGDIQGYYAGGAIETSVQPENALVKTNWNGSLGVYGKIEGLRKPEVAIIMGVVGRNNQLAPAHLKGEAFYFTVPWATDNSTLRTPTLPFTEIALSEDSRKSPHAAKERLRKFSSEELLELIKQSKPELEKTR
jgi:hypothetical protein